MQNNTSKNILSLLVFVVIFWFFNSFMARAIDDNLKNIQSLKRELIIKESFINQKSTEKLSKSINDFVPDKLDKISVINYLNQLVILSDSSIKIINIDVERLKSLNANQNILNSISDKTINITNDNSQSFEKKINTLKKAELSIKLVGNKTSLDKFLEKLVNSKQYIDIDSINFNFQPQSDSNTLQNISLNITANIYYKN